MNYFIFYIFLWILDNGSFSKVNTRNQAKLEAEKAFRAKKYDLAVKHYQTIVQNSYFTPPEVVLNQAHVLLLAKDTLMAKKTYEKLVRLENPTIASHTLSQLGLIASYEKDTNQALTLFQKALKINPENRIARYNFEILKRLYQPKAAPHHPPPQAQHKPKANTQEHSPEVEKNDSEQNLLKTLKNYGLSPEKAKMILDAMKNNEVQYIQQRNGIFKKNTNTIKQNW